MNKKNIIQYIVILIIIILIIYLIYTIYQIFTYNDKMKQNRNAAGYENLDNISQYEKVCNNNNVITIDKNICSRKCCGLNQYQTPFLKDIDDNSEERKKYVGSNMSCNLGDSSGCICITKEDSEYLANRGIDKSCNI
jgi:hypothetical protein